MSEATEEFGAWSTFTNVMTHVWKFLCGAWSVWLAVYHFLLRIFWPNGPELGTDIVKMCTFWITASILCAILPWWSVALVGIVGVLIMYGTPYMQKPEQEHDRG